MILTKEYNRRRSEHARWREPRCERVSTKGVLGRARGSSSRATCLYGGQRWTHASERSADLGVPCRVLWRSKEVQHQIVPFSSLGTAKMILTKEYNRRRSEHARWRELRCERVFDEGSARSGARQQLPSNVLVRETAIDTSERVLCRSIDDLPDSTRDDEHSV